MGSRRKLVFRDAPVHAHHVQEQRRLGTARQRRVRFQPFECELPRVHVPKHRRLSDVHSGVAAGHRDVFGADGHADVNTGERRALY
jgi:hypothetical protein